MTDRPAEIIILAGLPATGKSTFAEKMHKHFGYPVLEKDRIKESLFDTIGFTCYAEKRQLDVAANAVLIGIMRSLISAGCSMIVDNNFDQTSAEELGKLLEESGADCTTVFFSGDPQILYERYFERDYNGRRHPGHALQDHYPLHEGETVVFDMTREGFDQRFLKLGMDKMSWGGRRIDVDATYPERIDFGKILAQIESAQ